MLLSFILYILAFLLFKARFEDSSISLYQLIFSRFQLIIASHSSWSNDTHSEQISVRSIQVLLHTISTSNAQLRRTTPDLESSLAIFDFRSFHPNHYTEDHKIKCWSSSSYGSKQIMKFAQSCLYEAACYLCEFCMWKRRNFFVFPCSIRVKRTILHNIIKVIC